MFIDYLRYLVPKLKTTVTVLVYQRNIMISANKSPLTERRIRMYLPALFLEECYGNNYETDNEKVRHALLACENEIFGREDTNYADAYDPHKPFCRELIDLYDCYQGFDVPLPRTLGELIDVALMESGRSPFPVSYLP